MQSLSAVDVRAPVPPHPKPLPKGEGTAMDGARFADRRSTPPPLPKGEGWGEGKGSVENAPVPRADPLPSRKGTAHAGVGQTEGPRSAGGQATPPPLPKGEGRGAGEETVENAPAPKTDSESLPPGTRGSGSSS